MRPSLILVLALFFLLITLPYVAAAAAGGAEFTFGGFLINPLDGNTYLAKMYQGWRGEWRFTLPYTAQPGEGAYLNIFYIFLGHLSRWLSMPLVIVFHLARLLGATILAWALYRFLYQYHIMSLRGAPFATKQFHYTYALALLGSGMGWLVFLSGRVTSDFWVAEAYPFLSAYGMPHFALGLALVLLLLTLPDKPPSGRRAEWLAGPLALLLSVLSPFGILIAIIALSGLAAWLAAPGLLSRLGRAGLPPVDAPRLWFVLRRLAWVAVFGLPLLVYAQWVVYRDPVLAGWNAQNLTPAPPLWDTLLSLSPALLAALVGGWFLARRPPQFLHLVCAWAGLGLLLVYIPFDLQRRFMMGLFVPLVALAGVGMQALQNRYGRRSRRLPGLLLYLSLPTNLLLMLVAGFGILKHEPLLYLTRGEAAAFAWIETYTPPQALILAAPQTGLFIPAHTGRRVIYGHPFETVNASTEEAAVTAFFQGQGEPATFLQERQVEYIFYGPRERLLGPLPTLDNLSRVYSAEGVDLYAINFSP